MKEFDKTRCCVKCGFPGSVRAYSFGDHATVTYFPGYKDYIERLRRVCKQCGYSWEESIKEKPNE